MASTTIDAHADGLAAYLYDFRFYALLLQRRLYLLQTAERVAVRSRTAVDYEHFALLARHRIQHGRYGRYDSRSSSRHRGFLDEISSIHRYLVFVYNCHLS
jgi:hypothetical protein